MKYIFSLLLAIPFWTAYAQSPKGFTLEGKITGYTDPYVYLSYPDKTGKWIKDSAEVKNGAFSFHGDINEPVMATLYGKTAGRSMNDPNATSVFIEPTKMTATLEGQKFSDAIIKGSKTQEENAILQAQIRKVTSRWKIVMDTLSAVNKRSNFEFQELKEWVLAPYNAEMRDIDFNFFDAHPTSYVTAYRLRYRLHDLTTEAVKRYYDRFPVAVKQSSYGKALVEEMEKRKIGVPGATAANFSTTDINGQPISLFDFKGKYVLIDFWASWCLPCRKGNPHLKELYAQYKARGFEVIGVSDDDRDTTAWKRAVEKDGLPWKHVLRGMKMTRTGDAVNIDHSKDISYLYNISSLPTQILIDPAGKIIARYGEDGEDHSALDGKLRSVFADGGERPNGARIQPGFTLNGRYTGPAKMIYLYYDNDDSKRIADSAEIKDGVFTFKGEISCPTLAIVVPKPSATPASAQVFIEPVTMTLTIDGTNVRDATLAGSKIQEEWVQFNQLHEPIRKEMEPLSARYAAANNVYRAALKGKADEATLDSLKSKADAIHAEFDPYRERQSQVDYQFFEAHPSSMVTAYYLRYHVMDLTLDSLKLFYDRMGAQTQQTPSGRYIAAEIEKKRAGSPGSIAKDFTTTDINGRSLSLASFKGKYVLLDFWASWCGPCRKGNPHLKELYTQYKSKGLEIIGISDDDRDRAAWKKAVDKDALPWQHVLRGMNRNPDGSYDHSADLSELYGVHSLPTQVLIDPAGKIIARYGEDGSPHTALDATLASVCK
ncbi:MAG: redoxin domain-containing protein [Bacteroidetes bacterium]|nr:redoxin domain-containing protein [Bacteroidota bacterium]